jgi:carbonic anhydrase
MTALYGMRDQTEVREGTPLTLWLKKHGHKTVQKYNQLLQTKDGVGPIQFEIPGLTFKAYIDPEKKYSEVDRFSQVILIQ